MERKLDGLRAVNLGKSGYGPHQYLEVLERYGMSYKPTYALFAFYEGNDIPNIHDYMLWKSGVRENPYIFLEFSQASFIRRYLAAVEAAFTSIKATLTFVIEAGLDSVARYGGYAAAIHPKLAQLDLGGGRLERMLFVDRLDEAESIDEMLNEEEWRALERILNDFKALSMAHGITPIVMYIPAAAHVYAEYSTEASGSRWLQVRDGQIAAKKNTASAVARLAEQLDIGLIDLSPVFEEAARQELLYHQLDSHWTAYGREVAARYVAGQLKVRYLNSAANER
jgi:hypothetical protein